MVDTTGKTVTPLLSVTQLIHGILQNQHMTMRELVDCLMSEPYNLSHTSIQLVPIALNILNDQGNLKVYFRVDRQNRLGVESLFYTVS